jgi:opacity protein-like surface antigen
MEISILEDIVVHRLAAVFALLLLTTGAYAQVPGGNVFVGYSYMSADLVSGARTNLNGWNGSVEGKVLPFIGVVADFSGHYGSASLAVNPACTAVIGGSCSALSASTNIHSFLFGPRVSASVGKVRPFAHILVGASHMSENASLFSGSDTSFAYALGGGVDYHLIPLISWRVQADLLQTRFFSNTQNNVRISTGIAIRF